MAGLYLLFTLLGTVAVGGVEWGIRLPAAAGALAVVVAILVLASRVQRPADRQRRYPTGRDWVGYGVGMASMFLVITLGRLWEGRLGLLVLGGALAALPVLAILWWQAPRDTRSASSDR